LVNNAGIGHFNSGEITENDLLACTALTYLVALLTQEFLPQFKAQSSGILNIGGTASKVLHKVQFCCIKICS
jgi:short-subunit dehydrogenase